MRSLVVHLPGWLSLEGPSVLASKKAYWTRLVERSQVFRVSPLPPTGLHEAAWLGLEPTSVEASPGVLTVAALGADPPPRSVHFSVTPLVLAEDVLLLPATKLTADENRQLVVCAERLNTSRLTFIKADSPDFGLVWTEGSLELGTREPSQIGNYRASLPQGDGEPMLRRWIDDSINLLHEQEFNRVRADQGIETIEVLWPWGQGIRGNFPNLSLRYGAPISVVSASRRIQGLARLCAARHTEPSTLGSGTNLRIEKISTMTGGLQVAVVEAFMEFHPIENEAERAWLTDQLETRLWTPLVEEEELNLLVTATDARGGIALHYDSRVPQENHFPFDERIIDERAVPLRNLWELVPLTLP